MNWFKNLMPVSINIFNDGNEEIIEVVNNPNNKLAPADVVRIYENKDKGILKWRSGSIEEMFGNKKKIKTNTKQMR